MGPNKEEWKEKMSKGSRFEETAMKKGHLNQ